MAPPNYAASVMSATTTMQERFTTTGLEIVAINAILKAEGITAGTASDCVLSTRTQIPLPEQGS